MCIDHWNHIFLLDTVKRRQKEKLTYLIILPTVPSLHFHPYVTKQSLLLFCYLKSVLYYIKFTSILLQPANLFVIINLFVVVSPHSILLGHTPRPHHS